MSLKTKLILGFSILIGSLVLIGLILGTVLTLTLSVSTKSQLQIPLKANITTKITSNASNKTDFIKNYTLASDVLTIVGIGSLKSSPNYLVSVHSKYQMVQIKIWSLDDRLLFNTFTQYETTFSSSCLANDDNLVIGDGFNSSIYVYTPFGRLVKTIKANQKQSKFIIQLDDYMIASGNEDGTISIIDIQMDSLNATCQGHHKTTIYSLLLLQNGLLASSGGEKLTYVA